MTVWGLPAGIGALAGIAMAGLMVTAGCTSGGSDDIRVFAASSLTDAFEELAEAFEDETDRPVELQFAGSSVLATQIDEGAPADVFASANEAVMGGVERAADPVAFATNSLVLAIPTGTDYERTALELLVDGHAVVALCALEVPCGTRAEALLNEAGIAEITISREPDVKAVVAKVELGEVDAGVVYESDIVASTGRLEGESLTTETVAYPIAVLSDAGDGAEAFVEFVLSTRAQEILSSHGFGPAP